jgi:hypothetical protein
LVEPFVAEPVGDLDAATRVAQGAAARWGLTEPTLLRAGMNALFVAGDVVLRVGRTTVDPARATGLQGVLAAHGVAVARQIDQLGAGPEGLSVIAQEFLVAAGDIDWGAVGDTVRRVHAIDPDEVAAYVPVPSCTNFRHWRLSAVLDEVSADPMLQLDAAERRGLQDGLRRIGAWDDAVRSGVEPIVLCHGDVHPGNVLPTADGTMLLDWDLLCTGPAAWDHSAMLTWETRWGGAPGTYEAFAEGFGRDLRGDPLATALAEGRLLAATLMRLRAGRHDPHALAEARRRLRYWTGDPAAPQWRAA